MLVRVLALHLIVSLGISLACWLFPKPGLWLLGGSYAHLERELLWYSVSAGIAGVTAITWGLCTARGWTKFIWMNIPVTIAAQFAGIKIFDLKTVLGVIQFGILGSAISLLVSLAIITKEYRRFPVC